MLKKITVAVTEEMYNSLEKERKAMQLPNVQDVARHIFAEYFKRKNS